MIREITEEDIGQLSDLCSEEGHSSFLSTHVIERGGEITGSLSIDAAVPILIFLSKKHKNRLDMLSIRRFVKSYCDSISINNVLVNIQPDSPGWKVMEKMGYSYVGSTHLWTNSK